MAGLLLSDPDLFGHRSVIGCGDDTVQVRVRPKEWVSQIIRKGHYSGTVSWASNEHYGVFMDDIAIGALQFGPAMNPKSGARVVQGTQPDQWLELNRMWLVDEKPRNCTSRVVSFALRLLRKRRPRIAWVQSYADSRCGKMGGIYQACSFLYCGSHETTFYELEGEFYHQSMMGRPEIDKRGWGSGPRIKRLNQNREQAVRHVFTQYRYIKPLVKWAKCNLLLSVQPYPKPSTIERRNYGR
jgi:hypothetical protein